MGDVTTIGLDIAKTSFQAHGADASGAVVFRKKLSRGRLLAFFAAQPPCLVVMETCSGAHHWGRELTRLGHTIRLIPPAYVKPFVKRQKNDEADAEAICEAAQRPTMRFVAVKSAEQEALGVVFRARDLLVRQRTQIINAIRGHVAEYGKVAPKGVCYVERLVSAIDDPESELPQAARASLQVLTEVLAKLADQIAVLDREIASRVKEDPIARRLMTIPGVGPITAAALLALAPAPQTFRRGRDFSAWLGLTPLQKSTGGKQKLGQMTRMGERTLRRLLVIGASAVIKQALLKRSRARLLAGPDARAQAANAGGGRLGQQDRPHRLGAAGHGRDLSSSSAGGLTLSHRCETSRRRTDDGGYGATVGETGPGKPGLSPVLQSTLRVIWTRSANSIRASTAKAEHNRPDRWKHPTTRSSPSQIHPCAEGGVHRGKADL